MPEPLALAKARLTYDDLLRRRVTALAAGSANGAPGPEVEQARETAQLLDARGRDFADAVDRHNTNEQQLAGRAPHLLDYPDAVVLTGSAGVTVVDAEAYEREPVYWQATAGEVDSITHGADLDGYLRTGEDRYARAIGLA